METGRNCAYNVTRNALLSDRVMAAVDTVGPAEVLSLVLKGPGINRLAGVWVRGGAALDLPRAIDFDVAYLDDRQRIIAAAGVGLGADLPPLDKGAESMLILANGRVAETGTICGDQLRICREAELAVLLKAALQSTIERGEQAPAVEAGGSTSPIVFEVSRLAEFVFEPFAGSLMYLPQVDAPPPQSSEYFFSREPSRMATESVADEVAPELPGTALESESVVRERPKEAEEKEPLPREEPHFYAPKPVRFFDPSSAAPQDESHAGEMEESTARESIHLSAELKAAIRQIDNEQRRTKEELEAREKAKRPRSEKKKKDRKENPMKVIRQQEVEAVSAQPTKAAPLPESVIADTAVVANQEAHVEAEPPPVEAEHPAGPSAKEMREQPLGAQETEVVSESDFIAEPLIEVSATHQDEPASAFAEFENFAPEDVEQLEETQAASEMALPVQHEIEPVAFAASAAAPSPSLEPLLIREPVKDPVKDQVTEIKKVRRIKEPEPPVAKPELAQEKLSLGMRLQRWIGGEASLSGNRRKGERLSLPGLVAFYWSGGAPKPHEIVNISKSGFYLRTKEIWSADTMVRMTLQKPHQTEEGARESISVLARVVRIDEDGVGHEFITSEALHAVRSHEILPEMGTNRKELEGFLGQGSHSRKR